MAFKVHKGKVKTVSLPVTVSTALSANSLVAFSSGRLIAATDSTAKEDIVGILPKAIASTDDDYATTRNVQVIVPLDKNVEVEADVTSGLVAADVGLYVDLTDAVTINRAASTEDIAQCVRVISSTKGIFKLNIGGAGV